MGYFLIVPTYLHVYGGRDCRVNGLKRGHGPTTAVESGVLHLVCVCVCVCVRVCECVRVRETESVMIILWQSAGLAWPVPMASLVPSLT